MLYVNDSNSPEFISHGPFNHPVSYKTKIHTSLKIDRLVIILSLDEQDSESITNALAGYLQDTIALGAVGLARASWSTKKGAKVALEAKVPTGTDCLVWSKARGATVQVMAAKNGRRCIRIDFTPLGLTPSGFAHLRDEVIYGVLNRTSADLLSAKVTRVDVAVDIRGVRLGDLAWGLKGSQLIRPWSRMGRLETTYFGSPTASNLCVYDKGQQQKLGDGVKWTRVEHRGRPNCPLAALLTMKCPLLKVQAIDVRQAARSVNFQGPAAQLALGYAQLYGVKALAGILPASKGAGQSLSPQAKLTKALEAAVPAWWDVAEIWQGWPAAVEAALPGVFATHP